MAKSKTVKLEEPDHFGAVRYRVTYSDSDGNIVDESLATRFIAEGYDDNGRKVASQHGVVETESDPDVNNPTGQGDSDQSSTFGFQHLTLDLP